MSLVHFDIYHHTMKQHSNGAGAVRYLQRLGEFAPDATKVVTYLDRRGAHVADRNDLVATGTRDLPAWAEGRAEVFFSAATTYERANGRWATAWQATLPRELSPEGRQTLVHALLDTHLKDRPLLWAMHNPTTQSGETHPHVHILFSERVNDGIARETWRTFRRWNREHPEIGGAPKSIFGEGDTQAPARLRVSWCTLANLQLEREGVSNAYLDPRSLEARGLAREPTRVRTFTTPEGIRESRAIDERTPATRAHEQALAQRWWTERKRSLAMESGRAMDGATLHANLDAEVRLKPLQAREPARERAQAREVAREVASILETWARESLTQRTPTRAPVYEGPVVANKRSGIYHVQTTDPNFYDIHPHNMVVFQSAAEADAAGYRAAKNQHYARERHMRVGELAHLEGQRDHLRAEANHIRGQRLALQGRVLAQGRRLIAERSADAGRVVEPIVRVQRSLGTGSDAGGGLHGPGLKWGHDKESGMEY